MCDARRGRRTEFAQIAAALRQGRYLKLLCYSRDSAVALVIRKKEGLIVSIVEMRDADRPAQ